jgi:hypothetical protein
MKQADLNWEVGMSSIKEGVLEDMYVPVKLKLAASWPA